MARSSSTQTQEHKPPSTSEAMRYRQAAEDALQQLDWTIGYLHGIHKTHISKALARNRSYIRRELMRDPDPGLPVEKTNET